MDEQHNPFAAPAAESQDESYDKPRVVAEEEIRLSGGEWTMAIVSGGVILVLGEFVAAGAAWLIAASGVLAIAQVLLLLTAVVIVPVLAGLNVWISVRRAKSVKRRKSAAKNIVIH